MDPHAATELANQALTWIGFGTVVGLTAKAIMPGKDPGGAIATLVIGGVGSLIGCAMLKYFYPSVYVKPVSVGGFCVGTMGAFIVLSIYKIMGGYWIHEGEMRPRFFRRRRAQRVYLEE